MFLENINSPQDLKKLSVPQMEQLAGEMRNALLKKLSIHGGHFAPNLGMVEATIALHYVFNSPKDKFVFDVSHQTYPHKMLTGRKNAFLFEDNYDDVTGYSCPEESPHDLFTIGHTSTSVSLALGVAKARDLKGENYNVAAIIGDGSLSGGEALEGIDYAYELGTNFIIVVNDNDMSIAENHGGLYKNLKELRQSDGKCECNIFKAMGLDYCFVKDGNNIEQLINAFSQVKDIDHPVVVHICTQKGKGYALAEKDRESWHWCMPFDLETGNPKFSFDGEDYSDLTAEFLLNKIEQDKSVAVITSATPAVMGFSEEKRIKAGSQFIDVGIAEENAVAIASGIAQNGGKPVYGVYSTFIQRTFDQISQDVCINNNAVTFIVFSASVFGMNDVTHLGIYDIPMISNIPNMVYLAPTCKEEYFAMLEWAINQNEHPVAVRVPCNGVFGSNGRALKTDYSDINKYSVEKLGSKVAVLALGSFYQLGEKLVDCIKTELGFDATLINPQFISGVDEELLLNIEKNHDIVITLEDGILSGGFGEKISAFYSASPVKVYNYGLKKEFLDRYNVDEVLKENRLTPKQILEDISK